LSVQVLRVTRDRKATGLKSDEATFIYFYPTPLARRGVEA